MKNPTIEQLQNSEDYELIAELDHYKIKDFVIEQLNHGGKLVTVYMIYQVIMSLIGLIFLTRPIALFLHHEVKPLVVASITFVFCFSGLVVIHELLHGLAYKLTGAPKVKLGGYFSRFIFYAEADRHVLNRRQFVFLALTPLVVVQALTLAGAIVYLHSLAFYIFIITMSIHSLFCAGDIGLMILFYNHPGEKIYTFDIKEKKRAYFYRRKMIK